MNLRAARPRRPRYIPARPMHVTARRLNALILTAVLLIGGSGASALDVALYHLGGQVEAPASHRVGSTDAPRPHGDACALLDWAARGP